MHGYWAEPAPSVPAVLSNPLTIRSKAARHRQDAIPAGGLGKNRRDDRRMPTGQYDYIGRNHGHPAARRGNPGAHPGCGPGGSCSIWLPCYQRVGSLSPHRVTKETLYDFPPTSWTRLIANGFFSASGIRWTTVCMTCNPCSASGLTSFVPLVLWSSGSVLAPQAVSLSLSRPPCMDLRVPVQDRGPQDPASS